MRHGLLRWAFEPTDLTRSFWRVVKLILGVLVWVIIFGSALALGVAFGFALKVLIGDSD